MSNYENVKLLIKNFSGQNNTITIPRVFIELTGDYNTAILLNQIIFWSDKTKREDGFFYKTYDEWEEEILLSTYQVRRSTTILKDLGFVDIELKRANGSPTNHYKYKADRLSNSIMNLLHNGKRSSFTMEDELDSQSITDDYTEEYKQKIKPIVVSKETDDVPYEEIIAYLNEKAEREYRHTTPSTRRLIRTRFKEGFTLEDFKYVIDVKTQEWLNDNKYNKYLQPSTLFSNKFEGYRNQQKDTSSYAVKKPIVKIEMEGI